MKIVVVTSRFPYPIERGDKLRAYHQVRELATAHDVVLVALAEAPVPKEHRDLISSMGVRTHVVQRSRATTLRSVATAPLRREPLQVGYFHSSRVEAEVRGLIRSEAPDHVLCQLLRTAWLAPGLGAPCTIDFQDAFAAAMRRRAEGAPVGARELFRFEAGRIGAYEARAMEWFDHRVVISAQDRDQLEVAGAQRVEVLPNGVDTGFFSPDADVAVDGPVHDLVFVGNMGYPPNVRAAAFLAREVLPLVQRTRPGATLLLAGARPSPSVRRLEGPDVEVSGWLDDIRVAYRRGRVHVAPLFIGSGLQNKILESMAMGVPCVTTELVNNAIGAAGGDEVALATTPEEFAASALALLEDPEASAARAGAALAFVRDRFSWPAHAARLAAIMAGGPTAGADRDGAAGADAGSVAGGQGGGQGRGPGEEPG